MSDATPTPDPDGAIYPDGTPSSAGESGTPSSAGESGTPSSAGESGTPLVNERAEYHEPGTCDDGGDKCYIHGDDVPRGASETPNRGVTEPNPPDYSQVTSQVDGEMLIANLLVEIANLTRRALVAETMVQMYQRAAQPKSAQ